MKFAPAAWRLPLGFSLLVIGALVSTFLALRNRSTAGPERVLPRVGLGYYAKNAKLVSTGPDGQILYVVTTAAAEQVLTDGAISLRDVAVSYTPKTQVLWKLRAARGRIPPNRNIIELMGKVVATTEGALSRPPNALNQTAGPPSPPDASTAAHASAGVLIRTDYLEFEPDAYLAQTQHRVRVERARDTLLARGMRVYLKEDRVQFQADVQGRFLP